MRGVDVRRGFCGGRLGTESFVFAVVQSAKGGRIEAGVAGEFL